MNDPAMQLKVDSIKARIERMIEAGHLNEAKEALAKIEVKLSGDQDICSMRAVIHIVEGDFDKAETLLLDGLRGDSFHFDLLYNLAYIYEQRGQLQEAAELYFKAGTSAKDDSQKNSVVDAIDRLKLSDNSIHVVERDRIAFFVKAGMDSFLGDIIQRLSEDYFVRKIVVTDLKQIDKGMQWADICWFEWCDELVVYGSRLQLAQSRKVVCRLHRYEVFTENPGKVVWDNVDKLIIVTRHLQDILEVNYPGISGKVEMVVIENGVDVDKFTFKERNRGFNLAMVGYIHSRKNPVLLLQIIRKLVDVDRRYKLFIAGAFQEQMVRMYWDYQVSRMGLEENVIFEGWQDDINSWLEDKNYLLSTSIHESFGYGIAEAMTRGIKPVIYDFLYANEIWDDKFLYSTVDEAVETILSKEYDSHKYRRFIEENYSLQKQITLVNLLVDDLLSFKKTIRRVTDILEGKEQPAELLHEPLTVLIPNYNRARMLKEDLDKGLKLGCQDKLIVDDCSTEERDWLNEIEHNKATYRANIVEKQVNEGLAQSRWTGFQNIKTQFTTFVDDDDMLLCMDSEQASADIEKLNNGYILMIPRYLFNLSNDGLKLGYDRNCYNGWKAADVLKDIAEKSEIRAMLAGGSIGNTEKLSKYSYAREFRVAEDFVMLSRLLSGNPSLIVGTTESLIHIRRISNSTLSKTLSPYKLAIGLLAQCIACYHCLELGLASKTDVLEWMKNRAALIQKLYGFGESFESELIEYLNGGISEEVFIHFLALYGFKLFKSLDELAPELNKMRALLYKEPQENGNTSMAVRDLPLVSIMIPTFNRCDMLKRAIDSVLNQDYGNLEVTVMDNCSEDGTEEMIRSNYQNEKRLVYIRNERNLGPNASIVKGFYNYTRGKYFLLLFDDDYFIYSKYITECVDFLERHDNVSFVFGDRYHNNQVENKVYRVEAKQPAIVNGLDYFINFKSEKYPIMPSTNTVLFRRDIAVENRIIGGEDNTVIGDLIILVNLSLLGDIGYINRIAVVYTLHNGSMSCNIDDRIAVENDDGGKKAVVTAIDDIVELTKLGKKAIDLKGLDRDIINKWLRNRIFNYFYWRFNETVKSNEECIALLKFVKDNYNDYYVRFRDFVKKRYGEELINEMRQNNETCFYNS